MAWCRKQAKGVRGRYGGDEGNELKESSAIGIADVGGVFARGNTKWKRKRVAIFKFRWCCSKGSAYFLDHFTMLRLSRSRLLPRSGASRAFAPRATWLAVVNVTPFSCDRHVEGLRRFSSQTTNGDDEEKNGKPSLFSAAAWKVAIKPAYLTFLDRNKYLMVPVKFVVPYEDDAWPEAAWGYALGKHAEWFRKQWREGGRKINPEHLKELEEMSFAWDLKQYKWDHFVLPGLRRFYELNGHTDILQEFRIPMGDPEWPERLWGQKLGKKVNNIRARGDFPKQVKQTLKNWSGSSSATIRPYPIATGVKS